MYFLRSWKESLLLFLPQSAKLFLLVTIKTILQSYKHIISKLWWLLLLTWGIDIACAPYIRHKSLIMLIPLIAWLITFFCIFLAIRPSIARKTWNYYKVHSYYFIPFSLLVCLFFFISLLVLYPVVFIFKQLTVYQYWAINIFFLLPTHLVPLFIAPCVAYTLFFLFDAKKPYIHFLVVLWRALKMAFYNYPFNLIFYAICNVISFAIWYLFSFIHSSTFHFIASSSLMSALAVPLPLCFLITFYTKRLHDQFELYYPESIKD